MKKRNIPGITLIEVVLYLALFAIFFVVMIEFFFFVNDSNQLSGESLKIDRSVIFITQHLEDSFAQSTAIATPATDFDADIGALYLMGNTNINYTVSNSILQFNNGSDTNPITRDDLIVSKFSLEEIYDSSDTLIGVEITIELVSSIDSDIKSEFTNSYIFD